MFNANDPHPKHQIQKYQTDKRKGENTIKRILFGKYLYRTHKKKFRHAKCTRKKAKYHCKERKSFATQNIQFTNGSSIWLGGVKPIDRKNDAKRQMYLKS